MPFSVTCWRAGVLGLSFRLVLTACLFRIPRVHLYYGIVAGGVSLFNGKAGVLPPIIQSLSQ